MSSINSAIVMDFETGGLNPSKNPALQIAYQAIQLDNYKPILEYSSYIIPYNELEIDKAATDFNGITYEKMMSGIDTKPLVVRLCDDFTNANVSKNFRTKPFIVGHNIGFDIGFLAYIFRLHKVDLGKYLDTNKDENGVEKPKYIDTMMLAKQRWGDMPKGTKFNLSACVERAGIAITDAHDALNDVRATKELFIYFTNILRSGSSVMSTEATKEIRIRNHFRF